MFRREKRAWAFENEAWEMHMAGMELIAAYLINGEDELKRETVLKRLRTRLSKLGDIDFNCDTFDGEAALGDDIVTACNTMPFASEKRLVVVQNADSLKKADAEALTAYLKSPSPTTVLALVAKKLAKNTRLYKAVAAVGPKAVIDCAPVKKYELAKNVRAMAMGHGITLNDSGAQRLVELVGENTVRIDAELRKLALAHAGSQPVGAAEVDALVARTSEVKPWEFTDAFAGRDVVKCVELLGKMPTTSPHALIGMCVTRLRELIACHALSQRGQGGTKALAAHMKVPDWRVKNHGAWARLWAASELRHALSTARDTERAMKTGSDPDAAFLEWVLATASRSKR